MRARTSRSMPARSGLRGAGPRAEALFVACLPEPAEPVVQPSASANTAPIATPHARARSVLCIASPPTPGRAVVRREPTGGDLGAAAPEVLADLLQVIGDPVVSLEQPDQVPVGHPARKGPVHREVSADVAGAIHHDGDALRPAAPGAVRGALGAVAALAVPDGERARRGALLGVGVPDRVGLAGVAGQ